MDIVVRLIFSGIILFIGGFSIGAVIGLYLGERNEENDKHKRFNKNKRI